jgi:hypothetical protein
MVIMETFFIIFTRRTPPIHRGRIKKKGFLNENKKQREISEHTKHMGAVCLIWTTGEPLTYRQGGERRYVTKGGSRDGPKKAF